MESEQFIGLAAILIMMNLIFLTLIYQVGLPYDKQCYIITTLDKILSYVYLDGLFGCKI